MLEKLSSDILVNKCNIRPKISNFFIVRYFIYIERDKLFERGTKL